MTTEQVTALGPAFARYLRDFRPCFVTARTFEHLGTYCRGLLSDLAQERGTDRLGRRLCCPHTAGVPLPARLGRRCACGTRFSVASPVSTCRCRETSRSTGSAPSAGSTRRAWLSGVTRRRASSGSTAEPAERSTTASSACIWPAVAVTLWPRWTAICSCPKRHGTRPATAARRHTSLTTWSTAASGKSPWSRSSERWATASVSTGSRSTNGMGLSPDSCRSWRGWRSCTSARCRPTCRASRRTPNTGRCNGPSRPNGPTTPAPSENLSRASHGRR